MPFNSKKIQSNRTGISLTYLLERGWKRQARICPWVNPTANVRDSVKETVCRRLKTGVSYINGNMEGRNVGLQAYTPTYLAT